MKRIFNTTLIFFGILWISTSLHAKEFLDMESVLARSTAATIVKYPDADDVLIDDFVQVEYQTDGTSETWDDTAIKILTEKGKRDHHSLSLGFNISYSTNYFNRVQVIKPDGTVHEVDIASQSKVMVDPSQMSANIYNPNSKVLTLSVPGLEVGDTLRYISHSIQSKTVIPNTWSDYQVFEHPSPMERYTYQVISPSELPLKNIALKSEIPETVSFDEQTSEDGDRIIYTWVLSDVPRMFDEPNMPTRYTVVQRLLISTMDTWEDLSKWYWELCLPRLEATTPEMEELARELVIDCSNTLEKIEAIFNFVSQDIRYMGITTEDEAPGYEPHDVSITFDNRYGVCRDKAALLTSMLRIIGVEAFPVIIMAGPKKDEEVPQPFFNHAVTAALGDNGEYVLMDSTDENTKDIFPSYLQNMSYIVARPEGETLLTTPIIPATNNLLRITSSGKLDKTGKLTAQSTLVFEGINDTLYRGHFSKIKPEERKRFFEGHLKKTMPTAKLNTFEVLPEELRDTSSTLTIKLSYTAENLLIEGSENKLLNLPRLGGSLGFANFLIGQTGLKERKYPLYTRVTAGIHETIQFELPQDSGVLNIPEFTAIDSEQVTWKMKVDQQESVLTSTNLFLLNTIEFSPEEYLVLKQNLKDIEYNLRKKLIFESPENNPEVESDFRILEQRKTIVLDSESQWTETTLTRVKILTYAGTKKRSELKFSFNPAWQQVELTKATVTHPDGSIKEISDEEINIMDARWVASAPRFPAERLLVANLPGVEVGSLIEYETVSTVTGKPFFSTVQTFNTHEPVDLNTLTLTAPLSLGLNIRNTGIDETQTTNNGMISYHWMAANLPPVKHEENLPAWWTFNPAVFISTGTWEAYGALVQDYLMTAAEQQSNTEDLALQLIEELNDDTEKAVVLRDWVAKNLQLAGPSLTSLPLSSITPADQTLREGYGNNADRMVVLYTMLKAANLNSEFVLSGNLPLVPEEVEPLLAIPSRTSFNTVLIRTQLNGESVYLADESQYAEIGTSAFHRRPSLTLSSGAIGNIEVHPAMDDQSQISIEVSIATHGEAGLTRSTTLQGVAFEAFKRTYDEITPEQRRRQYLEMVAAVSQSATAASDLITDYGSYPGHLEYSVFADRYAVVDGDYLYFTLPGGLGGKLLTYRSSERTLPFVWPNHIDMMTETNVILPEGYEPVILPESFSWQAPEGAGIIEVSVEFSPSANAIRIVQLADLRPALFPASDFQNIVNAGRRLAHPKMRTILLRKKD
jgi:hypothetical protein